MTLLLLLLWLSINIWLVDLLIEAFIALTIIEQLALTLGIKLLLLSELMLSFACFWCYINFRLIGSVLFIFYFPLLSCYSFPIPFTNPLVCLFFYFIPLNTLLWSLFKAIVLNDIKSIIALSTISLISCFPIVIT